MSDEFENPDQDENSIEKTPQAESDEKNSALDDPQILESLKQLSVSESSAKETSPAVSTAHTAESIKNIVEAAILAAKKAISLDKILTLFLEGEKLDGEYIDKNMLRQAIVQLMEDYQSRGVELVEVSSGFRFQVAAGSALWVSRLWEEKPQKYSRALLETLALVAYRQPVTRGEIEEIRGVSVSSQIMRTLVEREWVRVIGHRDVPGKPAMYATTKQFLDYFSLKKLDELPTLSEIRDLDIINAELDFGDALAKNTESTESSEIEDDGLVDGEDDELSETYKQIDSESEEK